MFPLRFDPTGALKVKLTSLTLDTNGIDYTAGVGSDVITHGGGPGLNAFVIFNPNGNANCKLSGLLARASNGRLHVCCKARSRSRTTNSNSRRIRR